MDENRKFRPLRPNRWGMPPPPPSRGFIQLPLTPTERRMVNDYLMMIKVEGMRKSLCFSCAFSVLYDKNNKAYKISRTTTLEQVKAIVEEIKKINNDGELPA